MLNINKIKLKNKISKFHKLIITNLKNNKQKLIKKIMNNKKILLKINKILNYKWIKVIMILIYFIFKFIKKLTKKNK